MSLAPDKLQVPTFGRHNSMLTVLSILQQSLQSLSLPVAPARYTVTPEELTALHDPKSLRQLYKLGGILALLGLLNSSHTAGINEHDEEDIAERKHVYGANVLPVRVQKLFFKLCWDAMKDKVLIMLLVAAIVSLALGLYETFGVETEYDDEHVALPKVDWVEGVAIIVAVLIVVLVGAANDYQKEQQFARLNAKKEDRELIVVRNGNQKMISIHDLVVGDILNLQTGDIIAADLVLLEGELECDELALTGESETVKKRPAKNCLKMYQEHLPTDEDLGSTKIKFRDPMLISGAKVISGLGNALVTAVGPNLVHGRTMMSLRHEAETTPLQERLDNLAEGISKYGLLAALVLFIVLFIRFCVEIAPGGKYNSLLGPEKGKRFMDILITAITIIVVAVPEGLPLAVTLALAFATTRMAKNGNLVRVLKSCETMGGATAICLDKTGTLTENRMRVVKGVISDIEFDDSVGGHGPQFDEAMASCLNRDVKVFINTNITLNSTAFTNGGYVENEKQKDADADATPTHDNGPQKLVTYMKNILHKQTPDYQKQVIDLISKGEPFLGNKTESALLILSKDKFGLFQNKLLLEKRKEADGDLVQVIPFESSRKWAGVVMRIDNGFRLYVKGAAEIVFKRCGFQYQNVGAGGEESQIVAMDRNMRDGCLNKIDEYANDALRAIALAHRDFVGLDLWPPKEHAHLSNVNELADELWQGTDRTFVLDGIFGIQDPLKKGVPEAVLKCKQAGVRVRMVTGDNLITAKAILKSCHILTSEDLLLEYAFMEGPTFRKLSPLEKKKVVPQLKVLARSSPEDKRLLVQTLRELGEVVAVTGDGTNDAPALKLADVGFSMGIQGTEVAREASDIILMTDDFTDIVQAIKWGRTVSTSIKKFIQFQLTVNVTACVLTFVLAVASSDGKSVLTAVQLLWVNLIMDTLAALALATDKPDDLLLNRKPNGRHMPLILTLMWKMIIGQLVMQLIVTFVLHFCGKRIFYGDGHISNHQEKMLSLMTFNAFVWLQFWKLVVTRKLDEADGIRKVRDRLTRENLDFSQHLFRNWYFIGIAAIIGGFQVMIMYVGGAAFSIARQTGPMWGTALICGFLSIPVGWLIRICPNEWVEAIFPTRAFNALLYALLFKWLRSKKKDLEKGEEDDAEDTEAEPKGAASEEPKDDELKHTNINV